MEQLPHLGQIGDHLLAFRAVGQQGKQRAGDIFRSEMILQKLRYDTATGDEIDHGDRQIALRVRLDRDLGRVVDKVLCQPEGER